LKVVGAVFFHSAALHHIATFNLPKRCGFGWDLPLCGQYDFQQSPLSKQSLLTNKA
jgi:hypothetical protein